MATLDKPRRRIMRALKIDEISGVDRPAQEGAVALIVKRDGDMSEPPGDRLASARQRAEQLDGRRDQLERELDELTEARDIEHQLIPDLEAEIDRLRTEIDGVRAALPSRPPTTKGTAQMNSVESLNVIEKAVASAGADHEDLRRRCDDVFDQVVQKYRDAGHDGRAAVDMACRDPIAKRAYSLGLVAAERAQAARRGAGMLQSYLD